MRILLVQPKTPVTFWSFNHALRFIGKKAAHPPLGLLTVAAMLPSHFELKLVDQNASALKDAHIQWADYVFLTGMNVHFKAMQEVIRRCERLGTKVVVGGALCTLNPELFAGVNHLVIGEAEEVLPEMLDDIQNGCVKPVYCANHFPAMGISPIPKWSLIKPSHYATMTLQYSRGCPFDCEFCGIARLNGKKPRVKTRQQLIAELDTLYQSGWRGGVFIVDDNFIGQKNKLKHQVLPAMINWQQDHKYPFSFMTEVSINLADDDALVTLMTNAGFDAAFIGIETPVGESLSECHKTQNQKSNMGRAIKKLQNRGIVVSGGFIVGFDSDPVDVFDRHIQFIQANGIPTAMVGLLNAPTGSQLFERMKKEKRLVGTMSGDNTDGSMNFIPKMNYQTLQTGYKKILSTIYSPGVYLQRVKIFLCEYRIPRKGIRKISIRNIMAAFKCLWVLGVVERGKRHYWKLMLYCLLRYPQKIPIAIELAIYGLHFRRVAEAI